MTGIISAQHAYEEPPAELDSDDPTYTKYLRGFNAERADRWDAHQEDVAAGHSDPIPYDEWVEDDDQPEPYDEYMQSVDEDRAAQAYADRHELNY